MYIHGNKSVNDTPTYQLKGYEDLIVRSEKKYIVGLHTV